MALKYLFTVFYRDGTTFQQGPEDISTTREGGSAFTDVRQEEVERFRLCSSRGRTAEVDLRDGSFVVRGRQLWLGNEDLPASADRRLIFFRRHTHNFTLDSVELDHQIRYFIGWQATVDGRNVQQLLGID